MKLNRRQPVFHTMEGTRKLRERVYRGKRGGPLWTQPGETEQAAKKSAPRMEAGQTRGRPGENAVMNFK